VFDGAVDGFLTAAVMVAPCFALPFCACVSGRFVSRDPFGACRLGDWGFYKSNIMSAFSIWIVH
jgi:hypothetical protein